MVTIRAQLSTCHPHVIHMSFADLDQWPSNTGVPFFILFYFFFKFWTCTHCFIYIYLFVFGCIGSFLTLYGLSLVVEGVGGSSPVAMQKLLIAMASLGERKL